MANLSGVNLHLVNSFDQAQKFKTWLSERRPNSTICVDTETSGLDPYAPDAAVRLIQFGDAMSGWAIPWELWKGLAVEALEQWEGYIVGHNLASFDLRWIEEHSTYRFQQHRVRDTMIAAHIIDPLSPVGLKPLSNRLIDRNATRGERRLHEAMVDHKWTWATVPVTFGPYWQYGALDTVLGARIDDLFSKQVGPGGKYASVFDLEMAARIIVTRMEQRGARVDLDYCNKTGELLFQHAQSIKSWGRDRYGALLSSNPQLINLFESLGEEITVFNPKSGAKSVDKYQLRIFENSPIEEVAMIAEQVLLMRKNGKMASSYFDAIVRSAVSRPDGDIVHANIRTLGARTGRMSVSEPPLQQLPKGDPIVRRAFIAREGRKLISTDYAQVEMRLMAHFSKDPALQETFRIADAAGGDFFVEMGKDIYSDAAFSKADKRRGLVKNCVPLTSDILTKRGWLKYDEVKVGDETLGYDLSTGKSRWTEVLEVKIFDDPEDLTPVYRFSNGYRDLFCTDNHRWVADNGRSGTRGIAPWMVEAREIPGTENRIILASPSEDGDLDITTDEAAILGWVLGDGMIRRGGYVGAASQGADGWKVKMNVCISQTKPAGIKVIQELLDRAGVPYKHYAAAANGQDRWYLNPDWCRSLLSRAGVQGKKDFDPWKLALGLTHEARVVLADAIDAADGKSRSTGVFCVVQEAYTPVVELCRALGFLLGKFSRTYTYEPDGKGWQKNTIQVVQHQKPTMIGQRMTMVYVSDQPVWCVRTELGTWTMRQDGIAYHTGNTMYGKAYGAGVGKMAESAGVLVSQMEPVVRAVETKYPGLRMFAKETERIGRERENNEGQGYVTTPYGRRLPCDEGMHYTLVNYLLQGHAAEVFKMSLVHLDAAGWGDYMILPVHDEILMDVPNEHVAEALVEVPLVMANTTDYAVPILAESEGGFDNWGAKYL